MTIPEPISNAPPAAKLVYRELDDAADPITWGELQERTGLPESTLGDALAHLREDDVVDSASTAENTRVYDTS